VQIDRARKPSTIAGYESIIRSMLVPAFGDLPVESITTARSSDGSGASPNHPGTGHSPWC
jgi:hypothetical protein